MKKFISFLVILIAAALLAFFWLDQPEEMVEEQIVSQDLEQVTDMEKEEPMKQEQYQYIGQLEDVTGGQSSGEAKAKYVDGQYQLHVTFEDLPELEEGYFYEGWIVRQTPTMDVVSSGALVTNSDGEYVNVFFSSQDYSEHLFYVLTLEPDDGDPAPADHILEGTMKEISL